MRAKILLTNPLHPDWQAKLADHAEVIVALDTHEDTLRQAVADCDGMIVRCHLPEDIFDYAPRMKHVVRHGVGIDMIPVDKATEKGIAVANLPGRNTTAVSEYALTAILLMHRDLVAQDRALRTGGWASAKDLSKHCREVAASTCGIIGMGAIGKRMAKILSAMDARVLGYTRRPETVPDCAQAVDLDTLLRESDTIVVACALNEETFHLVNADAIAKMKQGVCLVNVARGAVIDTLALITALKSGQIGAAVLDVHEPAILAGDEAIFTSPNVLLTAHQAGITTDSLESLSRGAVESLLQLLNDERPDNIVNPECFT